MLLLPYLLLPNIQDMIMGGRNHALEKISRGSGSSKRGKQSFRNSCPVNKGRLMWSYWRMINFWLTPNNRKVIRLTQLGSLGTLVMSASSSTPTITVGNSHFFTGQKKSLKHPSMLRQQNPWNIFKHAVSSRNTYYNTQACKLIFRPITRGAWQCRENLSCHNLSKHVKKHTAPHNRSCSSHQLVPQSVKEIMHHIYSFRGSKLALNRCCLCLFTLKHSF